MLKVKLLYDYTKYNDKLEKGIEGFSVETPEEQESRKAEDHFVKVVFKDITEVDVPWRGLEIIDEDYLAEKERVRDEYLSQLQTAKNVVYTIGAKGGFKSIELDFVENGENVHKLIEDKIEGETFLLYLNKYGIDMKTIQLEKKIPVRKSKKVK